MLKEMASGSMGVTTASFLLITLDVAKVRIQQRICPSSSLVDCWIWSMKESGGMFRGLVVPGMRATCMRDVLNGACRVGLY